MKSPEEMEKALQRLIPPALSERAQADVSAMLSSLAASASAPAVDPIPSSRGFSLRVPLSIAAALAIATVSIAVWTSLASSDPQALATNVPIPQAAAIDGETSPVLIDRMLVTDGMTVEGTLTAADGSVMNQINRRVQTRERYRDTKKGYLITISETRDEKVYLPKKGF
ncbi:MAG: hypothetical protein RI957_602 [Verrucomicrobiota bacterium]|jgi:hypothetical protein